MSRDRAKETWAVYHRKDKDSPLEKATDNANVVFSSTPDTKKMGLASEVADLSGSVYIQSKIDRHTRLIAAAPDFLEACTGFIAAWQNQRNDDIDIFFDKMVEAVAKTEKS